MTPVATEERKTDGDQGEHDRYGGARQVGIAHEGEHHGVESHEDGQTSSEHPRPAGDCSGGVYGSNDQRDE